MSNVDTAMSRLCNRLMGATQNMLDTLTYTLDEMEYLSQQNPGREDIESCIEEVKTKIKAQESSHWVSLNNWGEHFDGVNPEDEKESEESEKEDDD
jgi:hypothetical protein